MDRLVNRDEVEEAHQQGRGCNVLFVDHLRTEEYWFEHEALEQLLVEPEVIIARVLDFPEDAFVAWLKQSGRPQCGGMTKTGERCQDKVSGLDSLEFEDWIARDGLLCTVHGGVSAAEARLIEFEARRKKRGYRKVI